MSGRQKEGAEAAKRRQEQLLEKEAREYHEQDGRQMGSGGKQPLDQLLASGAAHQRCYVCRRKRVDDDRAKVAEDEARVKELRARSRAGKERLARKGEAGTHIGEDASGMALQGLPLQQLLALRL
jgi:hypothetical protein